MKIRIQDHSIRFRLTLREVETLGKQGRLERTTQGLNADGPAGAFRYGILANPDAKESQISIKGSSIYLILSGEDLATLLKPEEEGVYIRREWVSSEGEKHRFMAFVEKDRPGSTCVKPEAWIYDMSHQGPPETRPIPKRGEGSSD